MNILNEAPRRKFKALPRIDTSGFKAEIVALMHSLATICHLQFKREWVDATNKLLAERKAQEQAGHQREVARYGEEAEPFQFEWRDYLPDIADRIWGRNTLFAVRSNIEHAHDEYQLRAAERHGYEDDMSNYIESSDYLSGMQAQEDCARSIEGVRSLNDPASAQRIIQALKSFLEAWKQHEWPSDGGEAPMLDHDFVTTIEKLLPLMLMIYS